MEFIINRNPMVFLPEQQKWMQQNPPSQFCITKIGQYECFIKRQKEQFSGWGLLVKAISEEQVRKTPKVISIAKDDGFYYFVTEKLEGMTLDEVMKKKTLSMIDNKELINSLFIAMFNINQLGFWYSDLCKKNIFIERLKKYYLIDIDSCVSHAEQFSYKKVSFEYPPILIEFSQTHGKRPDFHINSLSGECVNQAELVALAIDIKNSFQIPIDKKSKVISGLLHKHYKNEYHRLFTKLMNNQSNWPETRKLIDKIIGKSQIV